MPPPETKTVKVASLFVPEMKELLDQKQFKDLKNFLKSISCVDLAAAWNNFSPLEQTVLFRLLSDRNAASLFQEVDAAQQGHLLQTLSDADLSEVTSSLPPEEFSKLFNKLSPRTTRSLSRLAALENSPDLNVPSLYPEHSVGSWMHTQSVELSPHLTSSQALEKIRQGTRLSKGGGADGYYVTDKLHRVVGYVSLRELIAAPSRTKLDDYMSPVRLVLLKPQQDQEEAIQLFTRYKLSMAPVTNDHGVFLGYIQAEDIIPLVQAESTEDIQKLGGVEALDEPYFKISFSKMIKKRGTWLLVLFLGEMLTATAMAFFEGEIERAVVLALFIPLIISSGGNSGSQAASLIVRALALKEVTFQDWWRVIKREFASGLALGSLLGSIGFLRVVLWSQVSDIYGPYYMAIGLTVGLALLLVVLWGTLSGSLLPIFLRRIGFDPAVASAPFVATLVDVTGLVIYFSMAMLLLKGTLL